MFLAQGLWLTGHQTLTDRDYQYARCGREMWERPSQLAGYFTSCGNIHDGILAYRLAGLPLTLNLLVERGLDHFRKPEDKVVQAGGELSTWELRHQLRYTLLLLRLPFLAAGCLLGAGLWWVTRRLYGNLGGYTALGFYCFSPAVLRACVMPNADVLAALGVYGGVYTCIGVAHAMQGPVAKWRPRIVLLTAAFGLAAASHIAALPLVAMLGLAAMLWVAEGRRSQRCQWCSWPLSARWSSSSPAMVFHRKHSAMFSVQRRVFVGFADPARRFFSTMANAGITVASAAAPVLYPGLGKSRYFGNTAPLLCFLVFVMLVMTGAPGSPWLWALPFLLTFVGGVFADAYEGPRGRLAMAAGGAILALQAGLCVVNFGDVNRWEKKCT